MKNFNTKTAFALIVAAGAIDDYEAHRAILAEAPAAPRMIYCADGGLRHMKPLGLEPDVILGDFDSAAAPLLEEYRLSGAASERYPAEKDYTDTELAVNRVAADGYSAALILGALGGRIDHTFTNIQLIYKYAVRGFRVALADSFGIAAVLMPGRAMTIDKLKPLTSLLGLQDNMPIADFAGAYAQTPKLSLLPIGGATRGVTTTGLKYPLQGADLEPFYTSGVSNEFIECTATVEIREGALLVMICAD